MNMKKVKYFIFCCIVGFAVTSCGNKTVKGVDGTEYASYQDACRNNDFVAAYRIIELNDGGDEDKDNVFNAEMLYLVSLNTEEASKRVLYLLAEYNIPGTPAVIGKEYRDLKKVEYADMKVFQYIDGVNRFNARCNSVLDLAITMGNEKLANDVIKLYKKNYEIENISEFIGNGLVKVIGYVETEKENAIAKLEKAIEDGAFENKPSDDSDN